MKKPSATIAEIIRQEIGSAPYVMVPAFDHRQDISVAATIVDRTFERPTYASRMYMWNKEDKTRYAKEVQKVLATF